jgi:hypothetical protein
VVVLGFGAVPGAAAACGGGPGSRAHRFDAETGTIDLVFTVAGDFTNPTGNVLGAFVAAMFHDTVGPPSPGGSQHLAGVNHGLILTQWVRGMLA